jgi:hypothetical protein
MDFCLRACRYPRAKSSQPNLAIREGLLAYALNIQNCDRYTVDCNKLMGQITIPSI